MLTDRTERWLAAEMVREQVFLLTRDEVPYGAAVEVERWEERAPRGADHPGDVVIQATVLVERDSHRAIVLGHRGGMIRQIGSAARAEIARLIGRPVHLKLYVKVEPEWWRRRETLRELGYAKDALPEQRH
jgi:GTP-binding protein Era